MINEIKEIMERRGMTQNQVAMELGVSMQTVWRWVHAKSEPHRFIVGKVESWIKRNQSK